MANAKLTVLLTEQQIQNRVKELAAQIDRDFPGDDPIYLVCVLKGAVLFFADLARAIRRPLHMDFIGISSYGKNKSSSGEVKLTKDLDNKIEDCDVVIVEDILDSGITLSYLVHVLQQRQPRSVRIATLLDKPERRVRKVDAAYVGFQIPDAFVVGYGLDYAENYRHLRDVCILEE
ncbi:MAG: hypoxanthine phosphoribosyltransferase [Bryobacterales bacterium]|nr:hypoxanthine phosphoribosyltransferase [Bryobacterales bacterium]